MHVPVTSDTLNRFRALYYQYAQDETHSLLLDSCHWEGKVGGRYVMGCDAVSVLRFSNGILSVDTKEYSISDPEILEAHINTVLQESSKSEGTGWYGVLAYELYPWLENALSTTPTTNPMGELYWVRFRHEIHWDTTSSQMTFHSRDADWVARMKGAWLSSKPDNLMTDSRFSYVPQAQSSQSEFEAGVNALKSEIFAGNVYQANLSIRFEVSDFAQQHLFPLYQALVRTNPTAFSGIFSTPFGVILSNSPERLVHYDPNTHILSTRPIAGTRGRGKNAQDDESIGQTLQSDIKEQAEHMMMVDLERNDLGKISSPGSVHVPELGVLERYSHVTHLVSQIEGQKSNAITPWQIIRAMFPGGTITGCPKIRCVQTLQSLEPVARNFYTGSLGYISDDGRMDWNILIRSLFYWPDQNLEYHVGAGIVADSQPSWEHRECLRKGEAIQGVLTHVPNLHPA